MENEKLIFETVAKAFYNKSIKSIPIIFEAIAFNGKTYYKLINFSGNRIYDNILITKNITDVDPYKKFSHTFIYDKIDYYLQID